jgi:predicted DCC family thiol-disulfide oxidoreductase YuxK
MPADPTDRKAVVLYDGMCPFCRRGVRTLRKLDWLGRLRYQDARDTAGLPACEVPLEPRRLLEEMHVVTPDRRRAYAGYRAFRWLAWRLPPLWPVAPLMYVPGTLWLGNRAYRWVARHRFDLAPCEGGVCQAHQRREPG